jgi:hypothetical protein
VKPAHARDAARAEYTVGTGPFPLEGKTTIKIGD